MKHKVLAMLEADGVDQTIGRENIHDEVDKAVKAFQQEAPTTPTALKAAARR